MLPVLKKIKTYLLLDSDTIPEFDELEQAASELGYTSESKGITHRQECKIVFSCASGCLSTPWFPMSQYKLRTRNIEKNKGFVLNYQVRNSVYELELTSDNHIYYNRICSELV
jgi:hypothetical protein